MTAGLSKPRQLDMLRKLDETAWDELAAERDALKEELAEARS